MHADTRDQVLISASQLQAELGSDDPPVLLDVRWALGRSDGREQYEAGHIPGAVFVDMETELSGQKRPGTGRHPLTGPAELQEAMRRWGISDGDRVVAYDAVAGMAAARAWWTLRWAGVDNVRVLEAGIQSWQSLGLPLDTGTVTPETGNVTVKPGQMPTLTADQAQELASNGVLLDARAPERFRGDHEPIDPVGGHIPGAVNLPGSEHIASGGTLADAAQLRAQFAAAGVTGDTPLGSYCGSGVSAAHQVMVLATLGIDAALYPGSWSEWVTDSGRPIATTD